MEAAKHLICNCEICIYYLESTLSLANHILSRRPTGWHGESGHLQFGGHITVDFYSSNSTHIITKHIPQRWCIFINDEMELRFILRIGSKVFQIKSLTNYCRKAHGTSWWTSNTWHVIHSLSLFVSAHCWSPPSTYSKPGTHPNPDSDTLRPSLTPGWAINRPPIASPPSLALIIPSHGLSQSVEAPLKWLASRISGSKRLHWGLSADPTRSHWNGRASHLMWRPSSPLV